MQLWNHGMPPSQKEEERRWRQVRKNRITFTGKVIKAYASCSHMAYWDTQVWNWLTWVGVSYSLWASKFSSVKWRQSTYGCICKGKWDVCKLVDNGCSKMVVILSLLNINKAMAGRRTARAKPNTAWNVSIQGVAHFILEDLSRCLNLVFHQENVTIKQCTVKIRLK